MSGCYPGVRNGRAARIGDDAGQRTPIELSPQRAGTNRQPNFSDREAFHMASGNSDMTERRDRAAIGAAQFGGKYITNRT